MKRTSSGSSAMRMIALVIALFHGGYFLQLGSRVLGNVYEFEPLGYWDAFQVFGIALILFTSIAFSIGVIIGG